MWVGRQRILTCPTVLAVALVIVLAHLGRAVTARPRRQPVVGEMAGGLLAGSSALGASWPSGQAALFTPSVLDAMNVVAYLGLVVFTPGYGLRVDRLPARGRTVPLVTTSAMLLPFLSGIGVGPDDRGTADRSRAVVRRARGLRRVGADTAPAARPARPGASRAAASPNWSWRPSARSTT